MLFSRVMSVRPWLRADDASAEQMVALRAEQGFAAQQERMRTLSKALEKANRAGKPIVISRLPGSASSQDSAGTAYLTGDPALLMALQPRVRVDGCPSSAVPDGSA